MGIVIINGRRYDSITGLMIQESEVGGNDLNHIISNGVVHDKSDQQAKSDQYRHVINRKQPDWIVNYVEGGRPLATVPVNESEAKFRQMVRNRQAIGLRRRAKHSWTLSRRFVRKPSSESADKQYSKPLALLSIHRSSRDQSTEKSRSTNTGSKDTKSGPDEPFRAIFTRRQEEQLSNHVKTNNLSNNTEATINESIKSYTYQPNHHISSTDDRLSILSQVLDNENSKASKASKTVRSNNSVPSTRKTSKSARRTKSNVTTKHRFKSQAIAAFALTLAIVAGYGTYVAMPSISVKIAANQAGIDAKSPYAPSGYTIDGPVAYSPGQVTINYKDKSGQTNYSVTQTKGNSVGSNNDTKIVDAGNVAIYKDGNSASWSKNDITYSINQYGSLNDDQIIQIANSL